MITVGMKKLPLLTFFLQLLLATCSTTVEYPSRMLHGQGELRGSYVTENGTTAEVYLGVPYAQPPVGDLRFENPQPPLPYPNGVYEATKMPDWCVQFWFMTDTEDKMTTRQTSEDCLYFNLYIPTSANSRQPTPFPVLVWIHGGSYQVNGANMFPTKGTIRNIVSRGIAVLTLNYRLGPLGFLSTLSKELPGNYGMEDQVAVLKWIHKHGAAMNLDTNRITVGGESAGAACASLLAASDRSRHLFANVIMRSGSGLSPWAVRSRNTNLNSELIATLVECHERATEFNHAHVKACLKTVDVEKWRKAWHVIGSNDVEFISSLGTVRGDNFNHPFLAHTYFTPVVVDVRKVDALIQTIPTKIVNKHGTKPAMIGNTRGECAAYVMWLYFNKKFIHPPLDVRNLDYVVPYVLYKNKEQVQEAVAMRYRLYENENMGRDLVKVVSDQNFIVPAIEEANVYVKNGAPVYTYVFDYQTEELRNRSAQVNLYDVGAGHGFDMVFLFHNRSVLEVASGELEWTQQDLQITNQLATALTNFVKYSTPQSSNWKPYSGYHTGEALFTFDNGSSSMRPFFPHEHTFWHETIVVVDQLTYTGEYRHYNPLMCVSMSDKWYEYAFYVSCFLLALAILTLTVYMCTNKIRAHKHLTYEVNKSPTRSKK